MWVTVPLTMLLADKSVFHMSFFGTELVQAPTRKFDSLDAWHTIKSPIWRDRDFKEQLLYLKRSRNLFFFLFLWCVTVLPMFI